MKASTFIQSVSRLSPTPAELKHIESKELIEEFSKSLKIEAFAPIDNDHPLISIVNSCDTQYFVIFTFSFNREITQIDKYSVFGEYESSSMAINNKTGAIVEIIHDYVEDFESGYISEITDVTHVAASQAQFLNTLYITAELSSKVLKNEVSLKQDTEVLKSYAIRCREAAGGADYYHFWRVFVGYYVYEEE